LQHFVFNIILWTPCLLSHIHHISAIEADLVFQCSTHQNTWLLGISFAFGTSQD